MQILTYITYIVFTYITLHNGNNVKWSSNHIIVQMLDLSSGEPFAMHSMELPVPVRSLHPMSHSHFLVSSSGDSEGVYLLKKDKVSKAGILNGTPS